MEFNCNFPRFHVLKSRREQVAPGLNKRKHFARKISILVNLFLRARFHDVIRGNGIHQERERELSKALERYHFSKLVFDRILSDAINVVIFVERGNK